MIRDSVLNAGFMRFKADNANLKKLQVYKMATAPKGGNYGYIF